MAGEGGAPLVSVLLCTCEGRDSRMLRAAVDSVLAQDFADFELLLCQNGSGQLPEDIRKLAAGDSRICLLEAKEGRRLAYGLNLCLERARGKYLARMDDDDLCAPERLGCQVQYLESHPEAAFVGCCAALFDEHGIWGHRQMPERPRAEDFLRFSPYIHPGVMFRRSVFSDGTRYRTDIRRGEDYELFLRLAAVGCIGYNLQEELLFYREDLNGYRRRKLGSRLDEVGIRFQGFARLGILFPMGWLYGLRPLAAWCVPSVLVRLAKRLLHQWLGEMRHSLFKAGWRRSSLRKIEKEQKRKMGKKLKAG